MEKVVIRCIETEVDASADVSYKNDKHMRVVIENTTVSLELHRTDVRKPYVGRMAGLEFTYTPTVDKDKLDPVSVAGKSWMPEGWR